MKNIKLKVLIFCWGGPFLLLLIFITLLIFSDRPVILTASAGGLLAAALVRTLIIRNKFLYEIIASGDTVTVLYLDHFARERKNVFDKESIEITSVRETNRWPGMKDTMLVSGKIQSINFVIIDKKLHDRVFQKASLIN